MKKGQRVFWQDPISKKRMAGVLDVKEKVVAEAPMDEAGFMGRMVDVTKWAWHIIGEDGHFYAFPEEELTLDSKKFSN